MSEADATISEPISILQSARTKRLQAENADLRSLLAEWVGIEEDGRLYDDDEEAVAIVEDLIDRTNEALQGAKP